MRCLLWVLPLGALLAARTSEACTGTACQPEPLFVPNEGATIPANAPGVLVAPTFGAWSQRTDADAGITLASVGSGALPISLVHVGDGVAVVPQQPLVAGRTYILTSRTLCDLYGGAEEDTEYHSSFEVAAEQPFPQTSGELRLDGVTTREHVVPFSGASCGDTHQPAAFADFTPVLAPELTPFLPITRIALEVDGTVRQSSGYGGAAATPKLSVHSLCDQSLSYPDKGVAQGQHTAVLIATMPGLDAGIRSEPVDFELHCEPSCGCATGGSPAVMILALNAWLLRRKRAKRGHI